MATLTIRTTDINPSRYIVTISDTLSRRKVAADGTAYQEIIATKRLLRFSFNIMTQGELKTVMEAIRPTESDIDPFFSVTYFDTQTGTNKTGTFRSEDKTADVIFKKDGIYYFQDVEFFLTEQ